MTERPIAVTAAALTALLLSCPPWYAKMGELHVYAGHRFRTEEVLAISTIYGNFPGAIDTGLMAVEIAAIAIIATLLIRAIR